MTTERRILIFSTQMWETGGIENHLVRFAEQLSEQGVKLVFICPNYALGVGLDKRLRAHCESLIVLSPEQAAGSTIRRVGWLIQRLVELRRSFFDALYLNGQGMASTLVTTILGKAATRSVLHHHTSGDQEDVSSWPYLYRRLMKRADVVIACSDRNARSLESAVGRSIGVVYCFTSPCYIDERRECREALSFGFFGRLIPEKGIDLILKLSADSRLDGIQWQLWGGLEAYPADFCDSLPNVTYHGVFETKEACRAALKSLDAFVLFSTHNEGLPLVLLESMSAGVPWIASDRGGISDLVLDDTHTRMLSREFDYEEAVSATQSMAEAIRSRRVVPERLTDAYQQAYSPETLVANWMEVFFSPVGKH